MPLKRLTPEDKLIQLFDMGRFTFNNPYQLLDPKELLQYHDRRYPIAYVIEYTADGREILEEQSLLENGLIVRERAWQTDNNYYWQIEEWAPKHFQQWSWITDDGSLLDYKIVTKAI